MPQVSLSGRSTHSTPSRFLEKNFGTHCYRPRLFLTLSWPMMKTELAEQPPHQSLEGAIKFAGQLQDRSLGTDARANLKRFQPKLGKTDNYE